MRRWLGVGGGLLVLLGVLWLLRSPAQQAGGQAGTGPAAGGAAVREGLPLNALLSAPVPPARGDLFIRGRVVGPSGPLAGAVVVATAPRPEEVLGELPCDCGEGCERTLFNYTCGSVAPQLVALAAERRGEAPPQARTTTDEEGRFSLEGLEAGAYAVWAEGPPGTGLVEEVASGSEGVEVRLGEGLLLAGLVRDEDGAPVRGALVTAVHRAHSRYFEVLTGEDGRFRFGTLPPSKYSLVFSREGLLPEHQAVDEHFEPPLEVMMLRPQRLVGRVVRGAAPVPGATVRADGALRVLEAVTDAEGRFVFEGLEPSGYMLTASHEGEDAALEVMLEAQEAPPEVELSLGGGVRVRGTVRDGQGRPIADAEVFIWAGSQRRGADWTTTRTGVDGTYSLGPVVPGRYRMKASAARYREEALEDRDVDGVTPADFQLEEASVVEGRVVDAQGRAVAGARLLLRRQEDLSGGTEDDYHREDARALGASGESGEDGTFVLGAPGPGAWFLKGTHPDFVPAGLSVTAPQQGLRLVLAAGAEVTGSVVDEQGAPVREADVYVVPRERHVDGWRQKRGVTDARGHFTVRGVAEGAYTVAARVFGKEGQRDTSRPLEVRGTQAVHVQLQLSGGREVSGLVVDTEGTPIQGATVVAMEDETAESSHPVLEPGPVLAKTGAEGHFTLRHLKPGTWKVTARHEGYSTSRKGTDHDESSARVQAGSTGVHLVLRRMESVRGRVVREDGSPVTRFELNSRPVLDTDGAFTHLVYRPGQVKLTFSARGLASTTRTVRVAEGEAVELGEVVLRKGREVRGRVVDGATGAPVEGALVEVREAPSHPKGWSRRTYVSERSATKTGKDGTFTLPNVEEQPSALIAEHPGYLQQRMPLEAHQDEVVVALDPGAIVRGTARGTSGGPWAAHLVTPDGTVNESAELREGRFELRALAPGTYVLRIQPEAPEENPPVFLPRYVQVPASGVVTVDVEAQDAGTTVRLRLGVPAGEDVVALLVPGQVPMPGNFQDLERTMGLHFRAQHARDGAWTFQRVPAGPYTAFAFRVTKQGMSALRQELTVPAEGELNQELTPAWLAADFAVAGEDGD